MDRLAKAQISIDVGILYRPFFKRGSCDWVGGDSYSFHGSPLQISAEVLPDALETPNHGKLAVGEVFEEAVD